MWRYFYRTSLIVAARSTRLAGRRALTTAEAPFHQRIVSRRALQEYNKKHSSKTSASQSSKKKEEKTEWPRSIQIAGYVAAAVGIPYTIALFISTNQPAREALVEYIPSLEDFLRTYFGSPEEEELSYVEIKSGQQPHNVLPDEPGYVERLQQEHVHDLETSPTPVKITLVQEGQPILCSTVKKVPGWTVARPEVLFELAGEQVTDKENLQVAVDFDDLKPHHHGEESTTMDETIVTFENRKRPEFLHSSWYYQPPIPENSSSSQLMSPEEVEISRLEYEIQQLQADLKDINCTRNVDDMERDLREAKSQLRKIKWKRRMRLK